MTTRLLMCFCLIVVVAMRAATAQVQSNVELDDKTRIAFLEQRIGVLTEQVKALQTQAANAVYMPSVREPNLDCTSLGTLSPNDILDRTATYKAFIDRRESDYPAGYNMPVFSCKQK